MTSTLPISAEGLTVRDAERIALALEANLAPSTLSVYDCAWNQWTRWCKQRGLPALPATPESVAAYLAERADTGACCGTIDMACNAISYRHRRAELANPIDDPTLRRVRRGLRRIIGYAPRRRAHALTTAEVRRLVEVTNPATPGGARDRALILLGFASAMRPGELAALHDADITEAPDGLLVTIRRSKGDQEAHGQLVAVAAGTDALTDPVSALARWRWLRGTPQRGGLTPIFTRILACGRASDHAISATALSRALQRRAEEAGLGHLTISGHSLRAGHATTAALAGADLDRIASQTRHRRLETLRDHYIRPADAMARTTSRDLGL